MMRRRTVEVLKLLYGGDLLVTRVFPLGFLVRTGSLYMPEADLVDSSSSADWWLAIEDRLRFLSLAKYEARHGSIPRGGYYRPNAKPVSLCL